MTVRCVEPGLAVNGAQYLVTCPANDELLFPHVDSCLAIAFLLVDGRIVGGHVGMQLPTSPDLDPYGNANAIANQMIGAAQGVGITQVILAGDGNWENDFIGGRDCVASVIGISGCAHTLFVDTGAYGGGVDVSFNPRRQMMFVQQCTGGRALVYQTPYAVINGHMIKRLP
jgi:hypothetical protein